MKLGVYNIETTLFDGEVRSLTVATESGEITVLDDHLSLVTVTRPGRVLVIDRSGQTRRIELGSPGFLEVKPESGGVTILVE